MACFPSIALMLAGTVAGSGPENVHGMPMHAMAPTASLSYADRRWLVWTICDERDFRSHVTSSRLRYYRQDLYHPETKMVCERRTRLPEQVACVLDDGTLLLHWYSSLIWITPEGKTIEEELRVDGASPGVIQGFSDGVLVLMAEGKASVGHVYFAPIVGRSVDLKNKIQLTDGEGLGAYDRPRFLRHGELLAWNDRVFDLKTRTRRRFEPARGMKPWIRPTPTALDGQTLILHTLSTSSENVAVSLADGRAVPIEYLPYGGIGQRIVFLAVRNRIGYFFDSSAVLVKTGYHSVSGYGRWHLRAKDLSVPDGRTEVLPAFPADVGGLYHIIADEGLVIWDGRNWRTVGWLESIEGPDGPSASSWGEKALGLEIRASADLEIRQGMPLEVEIEFRPDPEELPSGVKKLDLWPVESSLTLHLVNAQTREALAVQPDDPVRISNYAIDSGSDAVLLDGSPIRPRRAMFPLARLGDSLAPGTYECRVEFSFPGRYRTRWWRGPAADWESFWKGTAASGPFQLKVLPEALPACLPECPRLKGSPEASPAGLPGCPRCAAPAPCR